MNKRKCRSLNTKKGWFVLICLNALFIGCPSPNELPLTLPLDPQTFDSLDAMGEYLEGVPQNGRNTPYPIILIGVNLKNMITEAGADTDGFKPLYNALRGKYTELDLDACTGATIAYANIVVQDFSHRPDKDKIVSLVLPSVSTRIGFAAFQNCTSLKSVTMPSGLKTIGQTAFNNCTSLRKVELPASLTQIEFAAFMGCSNLSTLIIYAPSPPVLLSGGFANYFKNTASDFAIYVPLESVETYKAAVGWIDYKNKIKPIDG